LAKVSASDEGDFFAARQSFLSILKIASQLEDHKLQRTPLKDPVTTASVISAGEKILECFANIDFSLFHATLHKARELAILGDRLFTDFNPSIHSPTSAFYPLTQILCRFGRKNPVSDSANIVGADLAKLLLSSAMILKLHGIAIPPPPEHIWIDASGGRAVPNGEDARLAPFFWAASRIAYLPEPGYQAALKAIKFHLGTGDIFISPEGYDSDKTISFLYKWAALPSHALIGLQVKSEKDKEPVENAIINLNAAGREVASLTREFVLKERLLTLKPN
jgi:hypothetical protein